VNDRERLRLKGPVRSLDLELAEADSTSGWGASRRLRTITFDREGLQDGRRVVDETVSTFEENGRRLTIGSRPPAIRRPLGTEYGIGIDLFADSAGSTMSTARSVDVVTRYDAQDRAVEITHRNAAQVALHRTVVTYDDQGRVAREEVTLGDLFGDSLRKREPWTSEQREQIAAAFHITMPDDVFLRIEYTYDERGRVAQRVQHMGGLSDTHQTYTYDEHDNIVEEHVNVRQRELSANDAGDVRLTNESADERFTRYEYRYDEHGNWTERVMLVRHQPDMAFRRSSIERRTMTYFDQ
jgi:YD repeat-containing protein